MGWLLLKGICVGGTLSIPGVSGGTMAIILGIYESLLRSFNAVFKKGEEKKKHLIFLGVFLLGATLGFLTISRIVYGVLKTYPAQMTYLFAGIVAGGLPALWNVGKSCGRWYLRGARIGTGIGIVLLMGLFSEDLFCLGGIGSFESIVFGVAGGVLAAFALILPGISVSHVLLVLGMYESVLGAVSRWDFLGLIPLALGGILGGIFGARWFGWAWERYQKEVGEVILGFVLGSVIQLILNGLNYPFHWCCIPLCMGGFCGMRLFSKGK